MTQREPPEQKRSLRQMGVQPLFRPPRANVEQNSRDFVVGFLQELNDRGMKYDVLGQTNAEESRIGLAEAVQAILRFHHGLHLDPYQDFIQISDEFCRSLVSYSPTINSHDLGEEALNFYRILEQVINLLGQYTNIFVLAEQLAQNPMPRTQAP